MQFILRSVHIHETGFYDEQPIPFVLMRIDYALIAFTLIKRIVSSLHHVM